VTRGLCPPRSDRPTFTPRVGEGVSSRRPANRPAGPTAAARAASCQPRRTVVRGPPVALYPLGPGSGPRSPGCSIPRATLRRSCALQPASGNEAVAEDWKWKRTKAGLWPALVDEPTAPDSEEGSFESGPSEGRDRNNLRSGSGSRLEPARMLKSWVLFLTGAAVVRASFRRLRPALRHRPGRRLRSLRIEPDQSDTNAPTVVIRAIRSGSLTACLHLRG
jgi:hypothetical protein